MAAYDCDVLVHGVTYGRVEEGTGDALVAAGGADGQGVDADGVGLVEEVHPAGELVVVDVIGAVGGEAVGVHVGGVLGVLSQFVACPVEGAGWNGVNELNHILRNRGEGPRKEWRSALQGNKTRMEEAPSGGRAWNRTRTARRLLG